jgi:hypothetical protein
MENPSVKSKKGGKCPSRSVPVVDVPGMVLPRGSLKPNTSVLNGSSVERKIYILELMEDERDRVN